MNLNIFKINISNSRTLQLVITIGTVINGSVLTIQQITNNPKNNILNKIVNLILT